MSKPPKTLASDCDFSRDEVTGYVVEVLESLGRLTGSCGLPQLTHMIAMARAEALNTKRNDLSADGDGRDGDGH